MPLLAPFLARLEKTAARLQGKGYGSMSVTREVEIVAKALSDTDIRRAVDIGGNIGDYTASLLDRFPDARVETFEPSMTNIGLLRTRFQANDRWTLHPFAVSDSAGEAVLHSDKPGSGLGSLTKRDISHVGLDFDVTEGVRTIRFEDYWRAEMGAPPLHFVKLDIEGHELDALRGFGDALAAVRGVQFEFGGCNIDTRTYFRDFWQFFTDHGFAVHRIAPVGLIPLSRYSEHLEHFGTANYLALR